MKRHWANELIRTTISLRTVYFSSKVLKKRSSASRVTVQVLWRPHSELHAPEPHNRQLTWNSNCRSAPHAQRGMSSSFGTCSLEHHKGFPPRSYLRTCIEERTLKGVVCNLTFLVNLLQAAFSSLTFLFLRVMVEAPPISSRKPSPRLLHCTGIFSKAFTEYFQ